MKTQTVIKEDNHQKISIISDDIAGTKYIERRIYDDKRELYKILQTVKHPNLIEIFDIDFDTETVIHEEYVDAVPLSNLIEQGQPFSKSVIKKISVQVAAAMEALHAAGIIHRDIKPDNILINQDFHVWLIDYDIARIYRPEMKQDTEIRGTFGYAPIEQYGMMPTDFKTDIYAFGVTLSKLLEYSGLKGNMHKIAEKCKRLDPAERYENALKLKKALSNSKTAWIWMGIGVALIAMILFAAIYMTGSDKSEILHDNDSTYANKIENSDMAEGKDFENTDSAKKSDAAANAPAKAENDNVQSLDNVQSPDNNIQSPDNIPHNQYFVNFKADSAYQKYADYYNFQDVMFFKTSNECNHLLMLEDGKNSGKIKLGGIFVDANFDLSNGELNATLTDDKGHSFSHSFAFDDSYLYNKTYTSDIRKNVDMICADISGDGNAELIIGISEGVMGISNGDFYSDFNCCIAWCITYSTVNGFKLADGKMFSRGTFFLDSAGNIMPANSGWGDEPYIYYLEGDQIVGLNF